MIDARAVRRLLVVTVLLVAGSFVATVPAGAAVARPAVTGLSAGAGPLGGGNTVSLTGDGFRSGVRVLFGSHAGTHVRVQSSHRLTVVAPAHAAGSVHVRVARGSATSVGHAVDRYVYAAAPTRIAWKPWHIVDPDRGALADVSCPTTTFCLAVDALGAYLTYDGSHWTAPGPMPVKARSVSCPDATTCIAAGEGGKVATWQAGTWGAATAISGLDGGLETVSCPTTSFCMLIDYEGHYATEQAGVWSAAKLQADSFNAQSLDCTSSSFCLMVDGDGVTVSWNGSTWHREADGDKFAVSLSCATPTFCVTVESYFHGRVFTWNGTTWSSQTLTGEPKLSDVDCTSTSNCVAVGAGGQAWVLSGSTWSAEPIGSRSWSAVSCASATSCVAVGDRQFATTFDGASWTTPEVVEPASGDTSDISCSSSLFCMVVDRSGSAVEYLHGAWQAPRAVYVGGQLNAVACPRSSFCLAVGSGGRTVTWNGSSWAAPVTHAGFGSFADVSCASPTSCVAVSGNHALHWTGSGWRSTTIAHASVVKALDCPTSTFCLAVNAGGYAVSWNGHSWSAARHVLSDGLSVACGAAAECYVGSLTGNVAALHGAVWSRQYSLGGGAIVDLACPSTTICAATATRVEDIDTAGFTRVPTFRGASVNLKVARHGWQMTSMSCPNTGFCALVDDFGTAVVGTR